MSLRMFTVVGAVTCAFATMGCSEAVPPASQAAFFGAFQSSSNYPDHTCDKDLHNGQIGFVDVTEIKDIKKDGEAGALVFCAVETNGDGFKVEAEARQGSTTVRVKVDKIKAGATAADPAMGQVTYKTRQTVKAYISPSDVPCEFWFDPDSSQEVAAGRIWAQFKCQVIQNASTSSACTLGESTIAFQNCEQ